MSHSEFDLTNSNRNKKKKKKKGRNDGHLIIICGKINENFVSKWSFFNVLVNILTILDPKPYVTL